MLGQTLTHYRIIAELGRGGMGVVYRARDETLGREVALKVVRPEAVADPAARKRLMDEARTASSLNHPHICTIYETGEGQGQIFVAMELVDGKSLSESLRSGGLPVETVTRYGAQIADALAHAHERGVVHRDLKPANIMVTPEGRAKVLDFGLARRFEQGKLDEVTRSQLAAEPGDSVAGTLAYMAPEQLRGEPADVRSDIWALGVALYEMAAGQRPFQGRTGFDLSSAILRGSAAPLPAQVPAGMRAVIQRCLAKEPGQRYQRASEVRAALEAIASDSAASVPAPEAAGRARPHRAGWLATASVIALLVLLVIMNLSRLREWSGAGPGPPKIESIAVLPLQNLSGDPNQEYFADGMTEAIITELAQISAFKKVTSRTSVMLYKQNKKTMPEIAKELGVDAIIEGSVQRSGNKVGITVQLIDPAADRHLWAKSYERDAQDILALQREVARSIADEIRIKLTPQEQSRLAVVRPVNPEAHNAYLLGRFYTEKRDRDSLEKAVESLKQAIRIDPQFAPAYAVLSRAYAERDIWGGIGVGASTKEKREAAEKAVQLDPNLAEAHFALAASASDDWEWEKAQEEYRRTFELNPNFPEALHIYAFFLQTLGRHAEAISTIRRAVELAPTVVGFVDSEGRILYRARRYDAAIARYEQALMMDPSYPPVFQRLADAYVAVGRANDALAILDKGRGISDPLMSKQRRAYVYAKMGRRIEALHIVREAEKEAGAERGVFELASVYAALGDRDRAFSWLEKAEETKTLLPLVLRDPKFDPLRDDPRYHALLRRMNLPE
jgi:serine/threonine-protein kinase